MRRRNTWQVPVRVKQAGQLGVVWPEEAQILMTHFEAKCKNRGLIHLQFQVDGLPISLNHMYEKGRGSEFCKPTAPGAFQDSRGKWRRKSDEIRTKLRQEVIDWRVVVMNAMGAKRWDWKPTGVTACMLLFETPYWITQKRTVREMDADNKMKPALDAIQHATDVPDELHWQLHVFKLLSKRQRTTIFLYDLGDVVEYYY